MRSKTKKITGRCLIAGSLLVGVLVAGTIAYTPPITGAPEGISSLEKVHIGGIEQWIMVRGRSTANPVLLFLHGGAGTAEMGLVRKHLAPLEEHFIIVEWDQRGAGKSCTGAARAAEFTIYRFVEDTIELTGYLRERFGQNRIYLIGHSWGSLLGMKAVQFRPEYYAAYIGTGQVSDFPRMEQAGYQFALEAAQTDCNEKAVQQLRDIGRPDSNGVYQSGFEGTAVERKWMTCYGGFAYGQSSLIPMALENLMVPEYNFTDIVRFVRGMTLEKKNRMMEEEVLKTNLFEEIPAVEVPVYFLLGRHDYNCPSIVAAEYFDHLEAPYKELVWFEHSAHSPCFEESEKFCRIVIGLKEEQICVR